MYPMINIFGKSISTYAICALIGVLLVFAWVYFLPKRRKTLVKEDAIITGLISCIGVLVGGHVLYAITNIPYIINVITHYSDLGGFWEFAKYLVMAFGGQVFYGGLLGGLLAGYIYLRAKRMNAEEYADLFAPAIPLFHAFGRIGCFLGGCCYGMEWEHGITYTNSLVAEANGVPRLPIQLIESGFNFLLFALLAFFFIKGIQKGRLISIYLITYAAARYVFECFRGDSIRGVWFGLSTSQWISIIIVLTVMVYTIVSMCNGKRMSQTITGEIG